MIVDGLCYLGDSAFGYGARPDELIAMMDEVGIDRAIACPVRPRGHDLAPANERVAEAAREHPSRICGFARVDPKDGPRAVEELRRAFDQLGLRGLFLHSWEDNFSIDSASMDPIMEVVDEHRAPVIVAAGYPWVSEGLQLADLAGRFPNVTLIATNGGQINISGFGQRDVEVAMDDNPNLLIQTGGVYREDFLENTEARLGPKRLVFASNFPLMDPRLEILRVRWAHFSQPSAEMILGGNLAELLKLSG